MKVRFFSTLIILLLFSTHSANAVSLGAEGIKDLNFITSSTDATITITPENPGPQTTVKAELQVLAGNASSGNIAWLLNGEVMESGKGHNKFTFKTGAIGEILELSAVIQLPASPIFVTRLNINPSKVTLLYESETYTPPFYQGRPRHSPESFVRLSAVAEIAKNSKTLYQPNNLIYLWSKNGVSMPQKSGLGKATIRIKGPGFLGSHLISVRVQDTGGATRATMSAIIESERPKVLVYEKKPLLGIDYSNALKNETSLSGPDLNLVAEPYFMGSNSRESSTLNYLWKIGGEVIPTQDKQSELLFNVDESKQNKQLTITVAVNNLKNLVQNARSTLKITITDTLSNFLF